MQAISIVTSKSSSLLHIVSTKMALKVSLPFVLLCFVLVLFCTNEVQVAEAGLCERPSKTWSGYCGISSHCDRQCRNWEKAEHGACHARFPGRACLCYFKC